MESAIQCIEGSVERHARPPQPGFYLRHNGAQVFCLILPEYPLDLPPPGQRVIATGQWSSAIKGFFEVMDLRPAQQRGDGPAPEE